MDLNKSLEYFNPGNVPDKIHIIGCGSVGSAVAYLLARMGLTNFNLYDDDIVEPHNIGNQMFTQRDISKNKAQALAGILCDINPEIKGKAIVNARRYAGEAISGYVFMCVDNIETRKMICEKNKFNPNIKMISDVRTGLENVEVRAAAWRDVKERDKMLKSVSSFTHSEAKNEQPTNACGMVLGVMSTVWLGSLICVNNFVNHVRNGVHKTCILADGFQEGGAIMSL